eukprot:TRINITY_DN9380_c0_g1_i1.p1 TRINITY_DN9380_c0_g1~~TRINITY_DN9380_c0_g1_i1.p1  ORF type:complete len:217 (-),score=22.65 TRINITY_DN9380_c0_g1_i1:78-728(-)
MWREANPPPEPYYIFVKTSVACKRGYQDPSFIEEVNAKEWYVAQSTINVNSTRTLNRVFDTDLRPQDHLPACMKTEVGSTYAAKESFSAAYRGVEDTDAYPYEIPPTCKAMEPFDGRRRSRRREVDDSRRRSRRRAPEEPSDGRRRSRRREVDDSRRRSRRREPEEPSDGRRRSRRREVDDSRRRSRRREPEEPSDGRRRSRRRDEGERRRRRRKE